MGIPFRKMHGLGNDFVVLDARRTPYALGPGEASAIADRKTGVGCDQLILLTKPTSDGADIAMHIYNADGSEPGACGNATRCIARLVLDETGRRQAVIETPSGLVTGEEAGELITIDMGLARLDWREIPLAEALDTESLPIGLGPLKNPVATSMGNPHATFFVDDVDAVPLDTLGPVLEHHQLFPERVNVGVAQIIDRSHLRLRVWERGAGITLACGTGACAAAVAAVRRGLAERKIEVRLDGGVLAIEYRADGKVLMTGPVATSFTGELPDPVAGSVMA
jgi:diaminopimelate epimerase